MVNWNIIPFLIYVVGMFIFVRHRVKVQQAKKEKAKCRTT